MDFLKFINENMLILVAAIYALGFILKATPKVPDWIIPWLLLVVAIVTAVFYNGFALESGFNPPVVTQAIVQGILICGAAVLGNQLIKQTVKGVKDKGSGDEEKPEKGI